ncbi:MAG: hypothetical protein LBV79_11260 [Candidatus Adiutrix sp.]|jgi:hypothetical protein|nr:hypothetical protein [Candidatus Adiutrix sp.]
MVENQCGSGRGEPSAAVEPRKKIKIRTAALLLIFAVPGLSILFMYVSLSFNWELPKWVYQVLFFGGILFSLSAGMTTFIVNKYTEGQYRGIVTVALLLIFAVPLLSLCIMNFFASFVGHLFSDILLYGGFLLSPMAGIITLITDHCKEGKRKGVVKNGEIVLLIIGLLPFFYGFGLIIYSFFTPPAVVESM